MTGEMKPGNRGTPGFPVPPEMRNNPNNIPEKKENDPRKGPDVGFGFNEEGFPLQDKYEFQGLPISVENKKGSTRKWYDPDGKEKGSSKMYCDYGYVEGSVGADGEDVDVYVGKDEDAQFVYVVHQNKAPDFESYDEDKVMIGFSSDDKARKAYLKQYNDDRFFGGMSSMPVDKFLEKVQAASGKKITNEIINRITEANVTTLAQMYKVPIEFAQIVNEFDRQNADVLLHIVWHTIRQEVKAYMPGVKASDPDTIDVWKQTWSALQEPLRQFSDYLKKNPTKKEFFKALSPRSVRDFQEELQKLQDGDKNTQFSKKVQSAPLLKMADGSFWSRLERDDLEHVAKYMQHCGQPVSRDSQVFQLFDKNSDPHVTVEIDTINRGISNEPVVLQIKGKQNEFPDKKYWSAVKALIRKFNASNSETLTPNEFRSTNEVRHVFKGQLPEGKERTSKSIKHLDDLPEQRFLVLLKALAEGKAEATEKLDGSARITFGEQNGRLWTQSKSGPKVFEAKAYNRPYLRALREAHEALESRSHGPGWEWPLGCSEMVGEVLHSRLPNSIEYGPNAVVVHRVVWDGTMVGPNRAEVEGLRRSDGLLSDGWRIDYRPNVKVDPAPFKGLIERLQRGEAAREIQLEARRILLRQIYEMKSAYGTQKGLVEGIVLRAGGELAKVVDRNLFTRLNSFFWQFREGLERGRKIDERSWQTGIMANFQARLTNEVLDAAGLKTKKFVEKVKGAGKPTLDEALVSIIPPNKNRLDKFDACVTEGQTKIKGLMAEWRVFLATQPAIVLVSEDKSFTRTVRMHELVIERTEAAFRDALDYFAGMSKISSAIKEDPERRLVLAAKAALGPNAVAKLEALFVEQDPPSGPNRAERAATVSGVAMVNKDLLLKRGIQFKSPLGQGMHGVAYDATFNGKSCVLKVTDDVSEANASLNILGKTLKHVVHIYDVFKFKDTGHFGIVQEKLSPLSAQEKDVFKKFTQILHYCKPYMSIFTGDFDKVVQDVDMKLGKEKQNALKFFAIVAKGMDFPAMIDEIAKQNIQFIDYHEQNVMKRGQDFVVLDLGRSHSPRKDVPVLESIMRQITEAVDRIGVTIGRFQPFHKGHAAIMRDLCKKYSRVVVLVAGNKRDAKNPFSYELRAEMMEKSLPDVFSKLELHKAQLDGKGSGYVPGILSKIAMDPKSAIDPSSAFEVLVGEDRAPEIQKQLDHARTAAKSGVELAFDPDMVTVRSIPGITNDDEAGRVSGTALRKAVAAGNKEGAKKLVDSHLASNTADFDALFARMMDELQGGGKAEAFVRAATKRLTEDLTAIGGESQIHTLLTQAAQILASSKGIVVANLRKLGSGDDGIAYDMGNGRVLKVTSSKEEAEASLRLMGKNKRHVVKVFDVFRLTPENQNSQSAYCIVQELLHALPDAETKEFDLARENIMDAFGQSEETGEYSRALETGDFAQFKQMLRNAIAKRSNVEAFANAPPERKARLIAKIDQDVEKLAGVYQKFGVSEMMRDLRSLNIQYADYHGDNIMKRGGDYVITDLGGSISPKADIPMLERVVGQIVSEIGSMTGPGDTQVGLRAGSSGWSRARGMTTGSNETQWQDKLDLPKIR